MILCPTINLDGDAIVTKGVIKDFGL
jgi:hypothetical protein